MNAKICTCTEFNPNWSTCLYFTLLRQTSFYGTSNRIFSHTNSTFHIQTQSYFLVEYKLVHTLRKRELDGWVMSTGWRKLEDQWILRMEDMVAEEGVGYLEKDGWRTCEMIWGSWAWKSRGGLRRIVIRDAQALSAKELVSTSSLKIAE